MTDYECDFHAIRYNVFRINFSIKSRQTLENIQVHFDTMFRYSKFQKFPVNRWENLCDFLSGKGNQPILAVLFGNLQNYTNVNHTCPFEANETLTLKADQYEWDSFAFKYFLPAGDFRFNITYTEGAQRNMLGRFEAHFAISDHRVWN